MAHTSNYIYIDSEDNLGVTTDDARTVLGENTNDIGVLCTSDMINPMSVKKPFRSMKIRVHETDLINACYGFGSSAPPYISGMGEPDAVWEYLKPRGKGGGTLGRDEWCRLKDFNGYYQDAVAPMKVTFWSASYASASSVETGTASIRVDFDNAVAGWDSKSLSLRQLVGGVGGKNLLDCYIAFVIYDEVAHYADLCITSTKFSDITNQNRYGFFFSKESTIYGGVEYPGLSVISSANVGHNLTAIICASRHAIPAGLSYQVFHIESSASSDYGLYASCYSLAFIKGVDRDTAKLTNSLSIEGTTGRISSFVVTPTGYTKTVSGYPYNQYYFNIKGVIDTRESAWSYGNIGVPVEVGFSVISTNNCVVLMGEDIGDQGTPIMSDAYVQEPVVSSATFTFKGSITLTPNTLQENKDLMSNTGVGECIIGDYIWLMKTNSNSASATMTVIAQLKQPGDTPITLFPLQQSPITITF